jgi:DNA-binding MarR family transcriptional regulator
MAIYCPSCCAIISLYIKYLDVEIVVRYNPGMQQDRLDAVVKQWQMERPNLDPKPLMVVGRILRLAGILERRATESLQACELPLWAFDVLGTLRRAGKPFAMTPKELMASTMLSSGAMTNRIDRLEDWQLVMREPAPEDRRSLHVRLTTKGLMLIDKAVPLRLDEAADAVSGLTNQDRSQLATLLRKLLLHLETEAT